MKNNDWIPIEERATEHSIMLPELNENGNTALKQWRIDNRMTYKLAARYLGVSVATYFRYESGFNFNMHKANRIVEMTNGEIRYRDLIADFKPEYA